MAQPRDSSEAFTAASGANIHWKLALTFLRSGLFTFGGGASVVPVLREEIVTRHGWFTEAEFLDAYTLGSTFPGPIATNLAGYIGHRLAGWSGAVVAVLASTLPVALAMILLVGVYAAYRDHYLVEGMLTGIRPVVLAMLALVVVMFFRPAIGKKSDGWVHWAKIGIVLVAFGLTALTSLNAAVLIAIGAVTGLLLFRS